MFDDPELDDYDSPAASKPLLPTRKKAPPLSETQVYIPLAGFNLNLPVLIPAHKKVGQLASLDKITADMKKRKQQWQIREQTEADANQSSHTNVTTGDRGVFLQPNSSGREEKMEVDGESLSRNILIAENSDQESDR